MNRKSTPIQRKLLRIILLVSGTVLLLTCAAFFIYEFITYRNISKQELQTIARITANNSSATLAFDYQEDAKELLQALRAQEHIVSACLFDKGGKLFACYPDKTHPHTIPPGLRPGRYRFTGEYIEGLEPVMQDGEQLGTLFIRSDTKAIYNRFILYGLIAFSFIALASALAYFLSKRLQAAISDPILELADKARIVSDKSDYSVRAAYHGNDEIGVLTSAFNRMLTQIQLQNEEINILNANLEEKIVIRTNELQKANKALSEQNEFIETVIDSSVDVIAVLDADLRFLMANSQCEKVYKTPKQALIGKYLLELHPELATSLFVTNIKKTLAGEFIHENMYRSVVAEHYFENFFVPLTNANGTVNRVLIIAHDITDIMRSNEELKELNAELEKSNRDLEQFAYVASHDLQEPLRKIQIFSELSERNLQQPEKAKEYLDKIHLSAKRMTELIKAVLNYSRISRTDDEMSAVDLNEIIENLKLDLELVIEEKHAGLQLAPLPVVKGIPQQLNQLFLNLISNSLKFSERRPEIQISATRLTAAQAAERGLKKGAMYTEVVFSDNGIGFDQQYAQQIFTIFQRLHTTQEYPGTGIGLALCKKIVENHGGQISVKSHPGDGTSFFIDLPLAETQKPGNAEDAPGMKTFATKKGESK